MRRVDGKAEVLLLTGVVSEKADNAAGRDRRESAIVFRVSLTSAQRETGFHDRR